MVRTVLNHSVLCGVCGVCGSVGDLALKRSFTLEDSQPVDPQGEKGPQNAETGKFSFLLVPRSRLPLPVEAFFLLFATSRRYLQLHGGMLNVSLTT